MVIVARIAVALMLVWSALPISQTVSAQETGTVGEIWPTAGWETVLPEAVGMDSAMLEWAEQRMATETPLLSAMVVVRGGKIVFEHYQNGFSPEQRFHIWSVSKSVTDIAIGMALEEGVIQSLDQTLGELIPNRIPADADPRVWNVTVEQLLTMTAGWSWDGRVNFARAPETDDLDLMLGRPMQCDPGGCFEYDSGCSNLLSYIIQERTGQLMADYLEPRLFAPLGIENPYWITTEDGATRGGGGLHLTPREMAKIGYLYLNGGRWGDRQIVSQEWVARSTQQHASGYGYLSGVNIGPGAYGYHWWTDTPSGLPAFVASGYGGQLIYVVPALDLVVVTGFAQAEATQPELQQHPQPIIEETIVPAAMADSSLSHRPALAAATG